jgi:mannose-6-phosphate isomerase-like protein (cupin superfamily)
MKEVPSIPKIDPSKVSNAPFVRRIEKPWGYEILWTPEDKPYAGKLMHIYADARLSLQVHDKKEESWFLVSGRAKVIWDGPDGELIETELEQGKGYGAIIGQRHRLIGITDCEVMEVSTPEIGITYRLEDDYNRDHETEEVRKDTNRGWNT